MSNTGEDRRPGLWFSVLAILTIAPEGFNLALPGADAAAWAVPIEVFHGVFIHNIMTFGWLAVAAALVVSNRGVLELAVPPGAWRYASAIAMLGVIGLVSTVVNAAWFSTLADAGETGRLLIGAFYFLLIAYWAGRFGPEFVMRWYLLGIAVGGVINIYFSITKPYNSVGALPFLYSRNGGGGILAASVVLGAWTWHVRRGASRLDAFILLPATLIGLTAVALSYSKTSMVIGLTGILTWLMVLGFSPKKWIFSRRGLVVAAVGLFLALGPTGQIRTMYESLVRSIETKFYKVTDLNVNTSVANRLGYYFASAEILASYPVFGVGYSGFYPAVVQTRSFKAGLIEEDAAAGKRANPHNSFLYYIVANGLLGLIAITTLCFVTASAVLASVSGARLTRYAIATGVVGVWIMYGNALPSLFKTNVMYLPAAAALAAAVRGKATR